MNLFNPEPEPAPDQRKALPVSRLLRRMRNLLEIEIGEVWVEGEVSNLRKQSSGHYYFSLKDEKSQIACAMFGARRRTGHDVLEDGAKVRVFGEVTVYEARGSAQLVVKEVEAVGAGALQAQFEALKRKLDGEGLFAQELKKPLPSFPREIAIVTSGSSAALQDMLNVLTRRAPWVRVQLYDVQVQGKGAEQGIARALAQIESGENDNFPRPDVVILGRGGGSLEDLWNFNEEVVARAIAATTIPVVSAVGHEIDFTIADFVADLRAPTPSAAAELVVPEQDELRGRLVQLGKTMSRRLEETVARREETLRYFQRTSLALTPERVLREPMMRLDEAESRLTSVLEAELNTREQTVRESRLRWQLYQPQAILARQAEGITDLQRRFETSAERQLVNHGDQLKRLRTLLKALGPESAFERGFSITMNQNGQLLKDASGLKDGDRLETRFKEGTIHSRVEKGPKTFKKSK